MSFSSFQGERREGPESPRVPMKILRDAPRPQNDEGSLI
jgi:hypothetical protein